MVFGISAAQIFGAFPAATGPITVPFQYSYNGLVFGAGTNVQITKVVGLRDLPKVRSGDVPKVMSNGDMGGKNFFDEKVIQFGAEVFAPQSGSFEQAVASMGAAFQNVIDPAGMLSLQFLLSTEWAEARQIFCRPTAYALPIDPTYGANHAVATFELTAIDPLAYSLTGHTVSTGLPSPTAGLTFPTSFPASFGASTGGQMQVYNAGNETTYPVVTITGPCLNPVVSLQETGQYVGVTIQLGSSDTLVIDMGLGTVMLNGTASRGNDRVGGSQFFGIPPGAFTLGVASADSAQVAATFTATWRDAWGGM